MSSIYADNVVAPWIQDNRWSTTGDVDDLLVISVPSAASADVNGPVQWNSGVSGQFAVYTHWDPAHEHLNQTSVHIEVPGFGPVVLFSDKTIDLKTTKPISVSLHDAGVYGDVQFVYGNTKKDIKLNWNITVPWFGHLDDGRSLFPTERSSPFLANKLQNVKVITDSEVSALRAAPLSEFQVVRGPSDKELILFETSPEEATQQSVAASFIHDNVGAGNPTVTVPALSSPKSEGSTLDITFLGVFQLIGTILTEEMGISAILYVKIPFIGRVQLVEIKGTLTEGIKVDIDLVLAKGSAQVSAKANSSGRHDLYIDLDVEIKFFKRFQTGDIKLFTLPF